MTVRNFASATTIAFCMLSAPAFAQTAPPASGVATPATPPAAAAPDDGSQIGDIVVTAQRREERLQDVPVAVTALTGDFIQRNQVRTLQDLGATVPGLVVTSSVNYGSAPLSIRGIGGANGGGNVFADEPVAVYVDDAYVARLRLSTADLIDIGGIEVLRGPQGVLFGRNSTAGAILIRSAEPTKTFTARASASATTLDEYRVQGAVSGPLDKDGRITVRLAGGYSDRGGWGTNSGGPRLNGGRDSQFRGFVRLQPTDALRIDLIADASYSRSMPGTIAISDVSNLRDEVTNPAGSNVVTPYIPRSDLAKVIDSSRYALNYPTFTRIVGQNYTGRVGWTLGPVALTSITNYRKWHLNGTQDSDGTAVNPPTPIFVTGAVDNIGDNLNGNTRDQQFSQELRLASTAKGPFTWIIGGFYFQEKNSANPISIHNALAGPGLGGTLATFTSSQNAHSWAAFASASYEVIPGLKLTAGGRYSEERKHFLNTQLVTLVNTFDPPGPAIFPAGSVLAAPPALDLRRKDTNFSPRVVVDYKVMANTLVYASFSKAFKSGGFNAFRGVNVTFEPEGIEAYEVGVKADLSRNIRANLSAFRYDYTNLQVRTPVASGGVGIESAAKARSQGVEAELTFTPVRGLRFDGNFAFLDATFRSGTLSSIQQPSFVLGTNPPVVQENIAGHRLTRAPDFQGALSGRYSWAIGDLAASVQGTVRHQSSVYFLETQQQAPTFRGSRWDEVDARIALAGSADRWEIALFGRNMFDNRHFSQITAFFGLPNGALNEPRKFGIQLSAKY